MTEDINVAEQIAELLDQQTYDERMEMGAWFETAVNGWIDDQPPGYRATKEDFAQWFTAYADDMRREEPASSQA